MPKLFTCTYDIVTHESAEHVDFAENGFAHPGGWKYPLRHNPDGSLIDDGPHELTLREALQAAGRFVSSSNRGGYSFEDSGGGWFTDIQGSENFRTGAITTYSIHPPRSVTVSSFNRIKRILCGEGR